MIQGNRGYTNLSEKHQEENETRLQTVRQVVSPTRPSYQNPDKIRKKKKSWTKEHSPD